MKELFMQINEERLENDFYNIPRDEEEYPYKYHLTKSPNKRDEYVLINYKGNSIVATGVLTNIKTYMMDKKIQSYTVFQFHKFLRLKKKP